MKFIGKIEKVTEVAKGLSSSGNTWQSCQIVAWNVNESGIIEKVAFSCLNASCEKAQQTAQKHVKSDGSFYGEFEFFFTPSVREYNDKNGKTRYACELNLNHIVEME